MQFVSDCDVWHTCPAEWLWVYDKLIVARRQGILSAPAGVSVPCADYYVVRPITNIRMMGRGASVVWLEPGDNELVPDGYFWSQQLSGDHVSVDYQWGTPVLSVQGFREDATQLNRFNRWVKVANTIPLPNWLTDLSLLTEWINVEYIGGCAIEVHLRYNDDFANHNADEIVPVWKNHHSQMPFGWDWYESPAGDRLGFWIKNK